MIDDLLESVEKKAKKHLKQRKKGKPGKDTYRRGYANVSGSGHGSGGLESRVRGMLADLIDDHPRRCRPAPTSRRHERDDEDRWSDHRRGRPRWHDDKRYGHRGYSGRQLLDLN